MKRFSRAPMAIALFCCWLPASPPPSGAQTTCEVSPGSTGTGEGAEICPSIPPSLSFTVSARCRNECGREATRTSTAATSFGSCSPHRCYPSMWSRDKWDPVARVVYAEGRSERGQYCAEKTFQKATTSCVCVGGCPATPGSNNNTTPGEDPLLISLSNAGYDLSSHSDGVLFDLDGDGEREQTAWTLATGDDAFLALDRNLNGEIDGGTELFGDRTLQLPSDDPNGFRALEVFDDVLNGGNDDGRIDFQDAIYSSLLLWTDADHDGRSSAGELQGLDGLVAAIDLDYRRDYFRDENGHEFRYWAALERPDGSSGAAVAWNVFFAKPAAPGRP